MKIDTAAVQLAAAGEIGDARDKFGALSEAIDTYMTGLQAEGARGRESRVLPDGAEAVAAGRATIDNPYYGKSMPTCGSFR